ncbi:aspartyl/asparaginyl beta-hydroxylase domain-containing protein [Mesorhizobium sp. M4A.F.Ca.ET.022.05.2.1]|uniref:aspartyl/asparaginyl beta-hydroxylase domain-containing protein n=1 Tax=unclassified Mesorhizobium TaxID=325217 RepID=UPI000FCCBC4D|nr:MULTISPECIES: aspartyl/asparaginyl beta-hydroxylase domain-containing protein [unclassified Mesorhizobium]RVC79635.1 aspartyl/asparaginyl beta-hydroxylase domain-containing protein [Mesorhizobium sp. M4A.F.Ca.ET.022.05.2.1]RVD72127.1 aspartyl/asparaginyl beta-hydroxylase domain-containing protein [Mesorhizobium sp. M4A.F.Ca.ET.029.04.2.1]TIW37447.1 MAG: aspartyl/asparaginyl beta-hydroxylase domain-containing protein [Mesorhizobium sp.]
MLILAVMAAFAAGSMAYVYRFRGEARYDSLSEYFRKGWPIFSPLNCVLYMTTRPRGAKAILEPADFPELELLRQNWQTIREEGLELLRQDYFDAAKRPGTAGTYDIGFRTFFKYGWSRFYIKWYGYQHHSARRLCPRTVEILRRVPSVQGAMFAYLPKGGQLTRHADPVAASLRYHLGLATPNSDACFINVDGRNLSWRDGEVLMFDETYLHFVRNDSHCDRLILMCDVKRPLNPLGAAFNLFYRGLTRASVVPNTPEDHRGLANRIFAGVAPLLARAKALKSANKSLYLALKWSVNFALLLSLFALAAGLVALLGQLA